MLWDRRIKIAYLTTALNQSLRAHTVLAEYGQDDYTALVHFLHRTAGRLQAMNMATIFSPAAPALTMAAGTSHGGDAMDWEPSIIVQRARTERTGSKQRAQWVSKEEIQRRRDNELCYRCGKGDHISPECNLKPAKRPNDTGGAQGHKKKQKTKVCRIKADTEESSASGSESLDSEKK